MELLRQRRRVDSNFFLRKQAAFKCSLAGAHNAYEKKLESLLTRAEKGAITEAYRQSMKKNYRFTSIKDFKDIGSEIVNARLSISMASTQLILHQNNPYSRYSYGYSYNEYGNRRTTEQEYPNTGFGYERTVQDLISHLTGKDIKDWFKDKNWMAWKKEIEEKNRTTKIKSLTHQVTKFQELAPVKRPAMSNFSTAIDPVKLRYNFKKGDLLLFSAHSEMDMRVITGISGADATVKLSQSMTFFYEVLSGNEDGWVLKGTFTSLRVKGGEGSNSFSFDSSSSYDLERARHHPKLILFVILLETPFKLTVKASGELVGYTVESLKEKFAKAGRPELLSQAESIFDQLVEHGFIELPAGSLKPGKTWDGVHLTQYIPGMGRLKIKSKSILEGASREKDDFHVLIRGEGRGTFEADRESKMTAKLNRCTAKGFSVFSQKQGIPLLINAGSFVLFDIAQKGQQAKIAVTTRISMTGCKISKKAFEKITNPNYIVSMVIRGSNGSVRAQAVKKLMDQNLLSYLAKGDRDWKVRLAAAKKLEDPKERIRVFMEAQKISDWSIQKEASRELIPLIEKLTDQKLLGQIAEQATRSDLQNLAFQKITEPEERIRILIHRANKLPSYSTERKKIKDQLKKLIPETGNQKILVLIATNFEDSDLTKKIITGLADQNLLGRIARAGKKSHTRVIATIKLTDGKILTDLASKSPDPAVRKLAVQKIVDPSGIAQIAERDESPEVQQAAVGKLTDQKVLARLAQYSSHWSTRQLAVNKVRNRDLLYQIAANTKDQEIREAVEGRLFLESVRSCYRVFFILGCIILLFGFLQTLGTLGNSDAPKLSTTERRRSRPEQPGQP